MDLEKIGENCNFLKNTGSRAPNCMKIGQNTWNSNKILSYKLKFCKLAILFNFFIFEISQNGQKMAYL